jgi:hypothetical protein
MLVKEQCHHELLFFKFHFYIFINHIKKYLIMMQKIEIKQHQLIHFIIFYNNNLKDFE